VGAGFFAGPGATAAGSYQIDQNGVRIASGNAVNIAFTAPAGVDPTLRVTASDSAGGSIRETILRAYGVRL
jgi:hypothetical protein